MSATSEGRIYGGLGPGERQERRRRQLLDAGLEMFARAGWNGTTVLDVCQEARLSQRYFYEQFRDREALFLAICERIAAEVRETVNAAAGRVDLTPRERASEVLEALVNLFVADPRAVRVALVESFATPGLRAHRAQLIDDFSTLGAQLMRGLARPPRRSDPRRLALSARILAGGLVELLIAAPAAEEPLRRPELIEQMQELWSAAAELA